METHSTSSAQNYITSSTLLGTSYGLLATTTLFFLARVAVRIWRPKAIQAEDYMILLAYLMFLALTVLYIVVTPPMYRVANALSTSQFYPEIINDGRMMTKTFFATTLLLWFILWSVKFAFLVLYRRLFSGIKFYVRLWWIVVIFCTITLIGCVVTNFTSCQSMHAWFSPGACSTPRDVKAQTISLYFSFAVDVITDLMIMFMPLGLIWNLQRPRSQKIGIGALFCIGWICIAAAIIRVVSIGVKSGSSSTPSSTWLAFWAIIESSIAVIIGCCPGLYATAKEVQRTRKETSRGYGYPGYSHGSRGYEKQSKNGEGYPMEMRHIPAQVSVDESKSKAHGNKGSDRWTFDGDESQEELKAGQILVTNSIDISDAVSIDHREAGHHSRGDYV